MLLQLESGLQNFSEFDSLTPTVICDEIRAGSVIVDLNIYLNDTETSAFDQQNLIEDSLVVLASSSQGFFDSSSTIVENTGTTKLF